MRNRITYLVGMSQLALVTSLLGYSMVSFNARAEGTCAIGYIDQLEWLRRKEYGSGDTKIAIRVDNTNFKTPSQPPNIPSIVNGKLVTSVWWDGSGNRDQFQQFITMVTMAYAANLPVRIYTWDHDCKGDSREFTIAVCIDKKDCNTATNNEALN